jgi:putative DNA primase/helicase
MISLRTAAAKYASLGYAIIPVHWIREDGSCSCGDWSCSKPGKHPIGKHGASDPITDAEDATQQWEELPHANIGIVAGPTGWLIVDIDSDQARDHFKSIADYETIEAMKNAPISKTGKGWHFVFRDDERSYGPSVGSGEDTGIDIRAGISFIVAPPSTHVSGHQYAWMNGQPPFEPAQPTRWLRNYIETRRTNERTIIDDSMKIPEGSRNKTIAELGGVMRRRGFNEEEIRTALTSVNNRANNPPLSQSEINNTAHSIATYAPTEVPASLEIANTSTDELVNRMRALNTHQLVTTDPIRISWVWDDYLAPGTLNMLHGDGGLGKSYLSLKIAEQMLQEKGGELFGKTIRPGGVVILDGENAENQIHHRIHNTTITPHANLQIYTIDDPILGYEEKTNQLFQWIADTHDPRLVIIDSQRALWSGDEKEQMEVGRMLRRFAKGLEQLPYAALLLHHDNRGKDYAGSSDMNAAISGARIHMEAHHDKKKTQARKISMPKNRIGPEMIPSEFTLEITNQPRSLRQDVSGISIRELENNSITTAQQLIDQVITVIHNRPSTNEQIWAALDWKYENRKPCNQEQRDVWEQLVIILVDRNYVQITRSKAGDDGGDGRQRVWVKSS